MGVVGAVSYNEGENCFLLIIDRRSQRSVYDSVGGVLFNGDQ
jgi:hypothetical protein